MDNHSNMDGLDGLPMDLWMNQQHPDSNMTSSVFHHPSAQPMRDYLSVTPRTMPAAFDDSLAPMVQNAHMMSSYGRCLPTQSHQPDRQAPTLERSAWSHIMSLDQAIGSYETQESMRHLPNRYSPLDEYKSREESLKPTSLPTSFPSGILPRLPSAPNSSNNFSPMSFLNTSQDKVSQLNELMNLTKTTKTLNTQSLTISTDVSSLESSGDYSPVSPPTTISDQLSSHNPNRVAETLRDDALSSNYGSLPADTTDIFSYFSSKNESFPISQDKLSYSQPSHVTTTNNLPSPSDVPLDMTKVIISKEDSTQSSIMPKLISSHLVFDSNNKQPMNSVGNERSPLLQTLLCKGQVNTTDVTNIKSTQPQLTFSPQIKFIQPVKSTPKKSNFYGRDASLFSFPLENKPLGSPHTIEGASGSMDSTQIFSFDDSIKNVNMRGEDFVDNIEESEVPNERADNGNLITDNVDSSQEFITSDHSLLAESKVLLNSMETSDSVSDLIPSGFNSSNLQSVDSFIENATRKEVGGDEISIDQKESLDDHKNEPENLLQGNNLMDDPLNGTSINDNLEPDDTTLSPPETHGKGKRKKRKGVALKAKPRKQPARKRGRPQRINVNLAMETLNEINDASADNGDEIHTEDVVVGTQRVRKKRGPPQPRTPNLDVAPRRSSSRKSKDNAMRLIELQADSNYSGIRQPEEEIPLEKKSVRKAKKNANKLSALEDELSDISDNNSLGDKSDDDYVIDEEEAQAVDNDDMEVVDEKNKKAKDKKIGGLKMSIKLSGNSSAEIVSGIEDSPVKRKRKLPKKKSEKNKAKTKKLDLEKSEPFLDDMQVKDETVEETKEEISEGAAADMTEKHMSLLQKYFSTASSATAARQTNKNSIPSKIKKLKKKNDNGAGNKSKVGKPGKVKTGPKQKTSVKFNLDDETKSLEDPDSATPKFVCGYCPLRYHSKQDLMTHMEAHMVEMEGKDNASATPSTEDKKKDADSQPNAAISRDPRSNRLGSSASTNQPVKPPLMEKAKTRPFIETVKENKPETLSIKNKFKCGECDQIFNSKPNLLDHVRIHTADKPFECDICHKCFTERNLLSAHRKTHVQEKLLRCHMCSKAFVDKADLSYHMQSHPKRSMTNSSVKMSFSYKKAVKKTVLETPEKDSPSLKAPTSFASALSGEPETSGNAAPLVILLKRGDAPSTSLSGKSSVLDSKWPPKPSHSPVMSQKVPANVTDHKQKESDKLDVGSKTKDLNSKITVQTQQNNNSTTVLSKAGEQNVSDVCSCKECPDCVTRFLQSFDC
ncbi:unnamed protein product [Lymnaea stagnalis]|uniref:C2H2-type domain-containing protein n=1 Tax=Lymnaea stagnalis TaxID=6523 RepID=A0AAV2HVL5_LYMST